MTTTYQSSAPPAAPRRRQRGWLFALAATLLLGAGAVFGGLAALRGWLGGVTLVPGCTATALGNTTGLDPEQAGYAATIAAVSVKRNLPGRAATIGIATAMQESKLRNLDYGDRDSLGLFQQRPSQGWGTAAQVKDPVYATNAFYDVLVKIEGYESLPITKAAQKVQRSAFPSAYAQHEPEARILASALTGYSPAGLTCELAEPSGLTQQPVGSNGLTARANTVREAAVRETGRSGKAGQWLGTASSDAKAAAAAKGTVLTFDFPSGNTADRQRLAWALAQWAVARADGLEIVAVAVDSQQWQRSHSTDGWTSAPDGPGSTSVLIKVAEGASS